MSEQQVIGTNLKHLRKLKGLTQQELADKLEIRRSSIGAYEECRATPKYDTLKKISDFFEISIDPLVKLDLSDYSEEDLRNPATAGLDISGAKLRTLVTTTDISGRENIVHVHQKAAAGYLNGFADPEYFEELPKFSLPTLGPGTFRAFEIAGDSMLPLKSGTVVIGEYVDDWRDIKEGETYIVISRTEGVVYKRVYTKNPGSEDFSLILKSDNPVFSPFEVPMSDVQEIWRAKTFLSDDFPAPDMSIQKLSSMIMDMQQEILKLKSERS